MWRSRTPRRITKHMNVIVVYFPLVSSKIYIICWQLLKNCNFVLFLVNEPNIFYIKSPNQTYFSVRIMVPLERCVVSGRAKNSILRQTKIPQQLGSSCRFYEANISNRNIPTDWSHFLKFVHLKRQFIVCW